LLTYKFIAQLRLKYLKLPFPSKLINFLIQYLKNHTYIVEFERKQQHNIGFPTLKMPKVLTIFDD